ncbi:MAG TPA: tripartite tricarboxylate transporter substrate binding protein [Burkholderiales bacterium]
MSMKSQFRSTLAFVALCILSSGALAQNYPTKPVRLVVGFPPGGAVDIMGRTIGTKLSERLEQPLVVDNRPGAGGNIAAELVAKSAPDGYVLLISAVSSLAISASFYDNLRYDLLKDFASVGVVGAVPNVLVVNRSVPAKSVSELIALAKSNPGQLAFGSAGPGTTVHFAGELFKMMAHVDMLHVPYKGAAPAMADLLGGRVQLMFDFLSAALPRIQNGSLRALGVTSATRSPLIPNVPTIAEAGVKGYEVLGSFGIFAPTGVPAPIINKLNGELAKVVSLPDVKEQMAKQGGTPITQTPQQLYTALNSEVAKWAKVVRATGVKMD